MTNNIFALRQQRRVEDVQRAIQQAAWDARDRELKAIALVMERLQVFEVLGPSKERPPDFLRERAEDLVRAVLSIARAS